MCRPGHSTEGTNYLTSIILLNSTCQADQNHIEIFGYNIHQRSKWNENHAGVAIAMKRNISYKLLD